MPSARPPAPPALPPPPLPPPKRLVKKGNHGLPVQYRFLSHQGMAGSNASRTKSTASAKSRLWLRPASLAEKSRNRRKSSSKTSNPLGLVVTAKPAESPAKTSHRSNFEF